MLHIIFLILTVLFVQLHAAIHVKFFQTITKNLPIRREVVNNKTYKFLLFVLNQPKQMLFSLKSMQKKHHEFTVKATEKLLKVNRTIHHLGLVIQFF